MSCPIQHLSCVLIGMVARSRIRFGLVSPDNNSIQFGVVWFLFGLNWLVWFGVVWLPKTTIKIGLVEFDLVTVSFV